MRLAFVDVETTGLSPRNDRIAEIGIITVDAGRVERWTSLIRNVRQVRSPSIARCGADAVADAPSFAEIASELAARLANRLFVAHNARFDYAFLREEFARVGVVFEAQVVCSAMLSRRLSSQASHHDLDSLVARHGLCAAERHRALPDADLVWQFWRDIRRRHTDATVDAVVDDLLAGPVLPADLDAAVIENLPPRPGVYVLRGERDLPLAVVAAGNLKLQVIDYFRLGHATERALALAHRVTGITWRETSGMLGARLHAALLGAALLASARRVACANAYTLAFSPSATPCITVVALSDAATVADSDAFGIFATERKARNALARLQREGGLCHRLLGLHAPSQRCRACDTCATWRACDQAAARQRELVRVLASLCPLRVPAWPHAGAIGIRERGDLHIVDQWRFLGTARTENDIHELFAAAPRVLDPRMFRLLERTLARWPRGKLVDLRHFDGRSQPFIGEQGGMA